MDASGVWGTESDEKNRVIYHKEPIQSSKFVSTDFWKNLHNVNSDMLLLHARATSNNGGHAIQNINNHPFTSLDKSIGIVHNGNLDEAEFLKHEYQTISDTDSEYLLRIYEHGSDENNISISGIPDHVLSRLNGIKEIYSYISSGAMAVALGEKIDEDKKALFLFRNSKRPLWLADLRDILGQIFFFSSPEIWYKATLGNEFIRNYTLKEKIIELPCHQIWYFEIDKQNPTVTPNNFFKFNVNIKNREKKHVKKEFKSIKEKKQSHSLITELNEKDELIKKVKTNSQKSNSIIYEYEDEYDRDVPNYNQCGNKTDHDVFCKKIIQLTESINTLADNLSMEGSISVAEYSQLLESLEQTQCDLEGTLQILKN